MCRVVTFPQSLDDESILFTVTQEIKSFVNQLIGLLGKSMRPQMPKACLFAIGLFNVVLTIRAFRDSHRIGFGPVDDHEIIRFLGPDRDLNFLEIFKTLFTQTEVGEWGTSGRYRPTYYTIRLFETFVFGPREYLWFYFRMFLVATSSVLLALVLFEICRNLSLSIRITLSISFSLLMLSLSSWPDIVMRLGPSEIFLVVGLAAFLYLSTLSLLGPTGPRMWSLTLIIAMLTIGTKENAAILLVMILLFVFLSNKLDILTRSQKVIAVATGSSAISIVLIPVINSVQSSVDVYGSSRNLGQLWKYSVDYFTSSTGIRNSFIFAFAACLLLVSYRTKIIEFKPALARAYVLIFVSLVPVTEYIFYQGIFTEPRYKILTGVTELILVFIVSILITETFNTLKIESIIRTPITAMALCLLLMVTSSRYLKSTQEFNIVALQKISGNEKFQSQISQINTTLKNGDFDAVVIIVNNVWEYEPVFTISHFISYDYGEIPKYLKLNELVVSPGLEQELVKQMNDIASDGSKKWGITRGPIPTTQKNLCVALRNGFVDPNICESLVNSE
jgi:hypothetical protein